MCVVASYFFDGCNLTLITLFGIKIKVNRPHLKALQPGTCGRTGSTGHKAETFCVVLRDVN